MLPYRNRSDLVPSWQYEIIWNTPSYKGQVACGANRIGKPICSDEIVRMADGSLKTINKVVIGDYVLSYDLKTGISAPSKVVNCFDNGELESYRVTFSDGSSVSAAGEHPFPVKLRSGKSWTHHGKQKKVDVKLKTLNELLPRVNNSVSMRTKMLSPVEVYYSKGGNLPIEPYALGVMLGDGSFKSPAIHSASPSVAERAIKGLSPYLTGVSVTERRNCLRYGLKTNPDRNDNGTFGSCKLKAELEKLGLAETTTETKFVPQMYLSAPIEDRKQLLAGLIDTDGFKYGFTVKSFALADGFRQLVRSIGGKATLQAVKKRCTNSLNTEHSDTYYNVTWRAYDIPVELKYKMPEITKRNCDYSSRIIRSIEPIGKKHCYCIEIEHEDHCFLIGDFIATCNSQLGAFQTAMIVTGDHPRYKSPKDGIVWIIGKDSGLIEAVQRPYFEKFIPKRYTDTGKFNGKYGYWTFDCDGRKWEVWFKSCDSGRKKFEGAKIDFFWCDEEPTDTGVFSEAELRLVDNEGIWLMTATPVDGTAWLKKTIERQDVYSTMAGMKENPYLTYKEIEKISQRMTEDERAVRVEGKYIVFGGKPVFPWKSIDRLAEHVRPPVEGILMRNAV
jgi:phage terminase large subunit-like protein